MELFLPGDGLQPGVIAMFMNSHNRIHFFIVQVVDGVVHLSNRKVSKHIERAIVQCPAQGTFQCKTFNPDPFVYRCKMHFPFPLL